MASPLSPEILFNSRDGGALTEASLTNALRSVGADDCQVLYMHTGLSFGTPNPALSRGELLRRVYAAILSLGVPTLCVPTFTFSFCNGEHYDVRKSRSRMGALNEFIRQQPGAVRSIDPLLSVALVGEDRDLVENLGHASIGENSTFDKLARRGGVKFLFLGVDLGACFTYMHHLEWREKVPYRYDRSFTGHIINEERSFEDSYALFVRYHDVHTSRGSYAYQQALADQGLLKSVSFGDELISCVSEPDSRRVFLEMLHAAPDFFIDRPFSAIGADKTFVAHNMVAL